MENQFSEFYQNFIENSLMPKEREDYENALKTFKLTKEDFIEFLEDLDNHLIEVDGEIIPDLGNLAQSKLIKALGPFDNSKIKKEQEALKNLNQHLLSLFSIVQNHNFKIGVLDEDYNRKIKNTTKVLYERFAHLNNQQTTEIVIKGQPSFILNHPLKPKKSADILMSLRKNGFISKNTTQDNFEKIFSGVLISKEDKIDWERSRYELYLFLKGLKPKLRIKDKIYDTALRCFTIHGREIIKTTELSNSSGGSTKKEIIKDIISLF